MTKLHFKENSNNWSISDERQFMENLFNQRLNFYIVIYSLIITGTLIAEEKSEKAFILGAGIILCSTLGLSLYRACHKLILILNLLHRTKQHPARRIGKYASRYKWPLSFPINHIMGIGLPMVTVLWLVIWLCMLS